MQQIATESLPSCLDCKRKVIQMTEFEKGYEQGYKDGMAGAALPNVNDNGDKIDGYSYAYKTDSNGEPYIHIDSVRDMLKKAADVQPVSVIKELQEHIKQRILETAFNNGGIYGEVAEDIANRIDIWVDEFRRNENA